jgi:hypothetical protein
MGAEKFHIHRITELIKMCIFDHARMVENGIFLVLSNTQVSACIGYYKPISPCTRLDVSQT